MISEMLEKGARAIYEEFPDVLWQPGRVPGAYLSWDELQPTEQRKRIAMFRRGLLAIREPDIAMQHAGVVASDGGMFRTEGIWKAMLDTILGGKT